MEIAIVTTGALFALGMYFFAEAWKFIEDAKLDFEKKKAKKKKLI